MRIPHLNGLWVGLVTILCSAPVAQAAEDASSAENMTLTTRNDERRGSLAVALGYSSVTREGRTLSGIVAGLTGDYALSDRWAVGGQIAQAFSSASGSGSLFTELTARLTYAITGSLITGSNSTWIGSTLVARSTRPPGGGFRAQFYAGEYLFNGTVVVPFSGIGIGMLYEFSSPSRARWAVGSRVDTLSNGGVSISPVRLFIQYSLF